MPRSQASNFDMINLEAKPDGVLVPVRVQPGAKRNGIVGFHNGSVKIAVNAAPERGKANQAVIEVQAAFKAKSIKGELVFPAKAGVKPRRVKF